MSFTQAGKQNRCLSFLNYVRDLFLFCWPGRVPTRLKRFFLGCNPAFVFLVHPRRKEDVFKACSFFKPLRRVLGKRFYHFLAFLPPVIIGRIELPHAMVGLVVTSTWLPELLLSNRKGALKEARRCLQFASKLVNPWQPVGLGGWWPIVTRRGLALRRYSSALRATITNGHCGTLCSLVRSVEKISSISCIEMSELSILVLGVGKMGTNIAKVLMNKVKLISLSDKNPARLEKVLRELRSPSPSTAILKVENTPVDLQYALQKHHFCICSISNVRRITQPDHLPQEVVILDDSRPEAFPRIYDRTRNIVVLEGGLMKIRGCHSNYDFGFGIGENVFGCLAEAYLLALCGAKEKLLPTIGDVDRNNFLKMLSILDRYGISAGDFKSGDREVDDGWLGQLIAIKGKTVDGNFRYDEGRCEDVHNFSC